MPSPTRASAGAAYRDASLPATRRVDDLLSRMTIEEKVAQMQCVWQQKADVLVDANGQFDLEKARAAFSDGHGLGQVGRPSDAGTSGHQPEEGRTPRQLAELTNAIQRFFIEESRLGIPVFFHEECLHGLAAVQATSFPQPIALGATFNPSLVEAVYAVAAREARSRGAHQALTPVVDVARDPRWGRVEETFGEDPFLVGAMGTAAVRGFQGDGTFRDKTRVVATLKHFAAHGQPESGMNCAPVNISERELRTTHLAPFKQAIQAGGALSVMASYNEIDGVPSHANRWLLRRVLRDEWGFTGFVVSDYYALWELHERPDTHGHHVAADAKDAARLAVEAGVNIELPEPDSYLHLADLVREDKLQESQLDELVRPMLHAKFALGLFDDPYVDPGEAERVAEAPLHQALALDAAQQSITLLKNEDDLLPLSLPEATSDNSPVLTIAVIGPNADRSLLGGYSGVPSRDVSVLAGIRAYVGNQATVLYAQGCAITVGGSWNEDAVVPGTEAEDQRLIAEAVDVARQADVVILAVGGNEQTAREAWSRGHMGDRTSLDLFGRQNDLVDALAATGKPIAALLFNGRPLAAARLSAQTDALLECWYLGQETGHAVADVLFGAVNPGGKLPISIPRSAGHVPAFYNHKPSARRGYLLDDVSPLYPFGFGLSYTTFEIRDVRLEHTEMTSAQMSSGQTTHVHAEITNTGRRAGSEVVQLYVRDEVSTVTRPVKELKGFERVHLEPGQTQTVSLAITPDDLAFFDLDMTFAVEPGTFAILVGTSSQDEDLHRVRLTITD